MIPAYKFRFSAVIFSAVCLLACEEAPFRTSLPDIPGVVSEIPQGYEGNFLTGDDSLFHEFAKSGLSAEDYIISSLEKDPAWHFSHQLYTIHRMPDRKSITFGMLITIPESRIDSGSYLKDDVRITWTRVLENLLRVQTKSHNQKDTTIMMPVWQTGKLFFALDLLDAADQEAVNLDGYQIVPAFTGVGQKNSEDGLTPGLLKEHDGSHYLILEFDESLFEIHQYHLTGQGFTRRAITDISLTPDPTPAEQETFLEKLAALRQLTPADTVGNSIVLNPGREHLNKLFNSGFAQTTHYISVKPAEPWVDSNRLVQILGLALLAMTVAFLLKGRRKTGS